MKIDRARRSQIPRDRVESSLRSREAVASLRARVVSAATLRHCSPQPQQIHEPWPDAPRPTPSASRSRAAGRSRPSSFRSARAASRASSASKQAGDKASGGLKGLGHQAELLRTGIRTLGGALIGAATVGGLGALIDRSISAADAIGKTADKIGVGVEALQELRFAAKASGGRAADPRHGAAALHAPGGGGRQRHVWASRCATRDDRARSS